MSAMYLTWYETLVTTIKTYNFTRFLLVTLFFTLFVITVHSENNIEEASSQSPDGSELAGPTTRVTWDPNDPADGTDDHSRDHLHDYDHYEKAHGHARDHRGQNIIYDHAHDDDEEDDHDELHHKSWSITQPGYDLRYRPDNTLPTVVNVTMYHDFIEYINENDGEIVMKVFVVCFWKDHRMRNLDEVLRGLGAMPGQDKLPLPGEMKERIWVPELHMPMARRVGVPTIHQPAESITLMANGAIKYSSFFVVSFKCEMNYHNYPMDVQQCDLDFMSYKYPSENVQLRWIHPGALVGNLDIHTKHFDVNVLRPKGKSFFLSPPNSEGKTKDVLRITYVMKRHLSFHLLQTYLPSVMLVFVGWLSLLVPLDFAYGRMVLSVTTLLVLVSFFVTTSQITPGTNEVKALDIWLFMCIFFVFSAIVNCIADLRFLSMVEKESQIAGEEGAEGAAPPLVDERVRRASQVTGGRASTTGVNNAASTYNVKFYGDNTPFQADKEVLIATPAVLKWLRLAVMLERGMTVAYPALFALFASVYWAIYIAARSAHVEPESDD